MGHLANLRAAQGTDRQPKGGAGLYMLTLRADCEIHGIIPSDGDIIYVGKASNLRNRDHFTKRTSQCTVRRSLAAILKDLELVPVASKSSRAANWTLDAASEERLTKWMGANVEVTRIRISVDKTLSVSDRRAMLEAEERLLIRETLAPLNLRDWPSGATNPVRERIEAARRSMTDQIRSAHESLQANKPKSKTYIEAKGATENQVRA